MHRDKFPEKIPFRLTRMLINAMEVCGIEGTFRSTCESVMRVLRDNKDSVMAMLEAFVHDPLINWRLLETETKPQNQPSNHNNQNQIMHDMEMSVNEGEESHKHPSRSVRERELKKSLKGDSDDEDNDVAPNTINQRALSVINRISNKLNGRDFDEELTIERGDAVDEELVPLDIPDQVQRLIEQATSNANLCQCYVGWCAFW